jgi:flavodoxin
MVIAPQVGYRYTYYRKENVTMYFSIFVGIMEWIDFKNLNYPFFAFQANLFGFSIGHKNNFYLELGCGNKGLLTLGYKFGFNNTNK